MNDNKEHKTVREHIEEFAQDTVDGIKNGVHTITEKIKETKDHLFNKNKNTVKGSNLEEMASEISHKANYTANYMGEAGKNLAEATKDNLEEFSEEANHKVSSVGNYLRDAGNNLVDDLQNTTASNNTEFARDEDVNVNYSEEYAQDVNNNTNNYADYPQVESSKKEYVNTLEEYAHEGSLNNFNNYVEEYADESGVTNYSNNNLVDTKNPYHFEEEYAADESLESYANNRDEEYASEENFEEKIKNQYNYDQDLENEEF